MRLRPRLPFMMVLAFAAGAGCTQPNPEYVPGDSNVTEEQFAQASCTTPGNKPGHYEAVDQTGGGMVVVPCVVRECHQGQTDGGRSISCDPVSWACSDEQALPTESWKCVEAVLDGSPCDYRLQCATHICRAASPDAHKTCGGVPSVVGSPDVGSVVCGANKIECNVGQQCLPIGNVATPVFECVQKGQLALHSSAPIQVELRDKEAALVGEPNLTPDAYLMTPVGVITIGGLPPNITVYATYVGASGQRHVDVPCTAKIFSSCTLSDLP